MLRRTLLAAWMLGLTACGGEEPAPAPAPLPEVAAPPTDTTAPTFDDEGELHADAEGRPTEEARTVTLHWTAATDDEGVVAYLVGVDDEEPVRVEGGDVTEATLDGVGFAEARQFFVRAVDEAGNESDPLTTDDALAPAFPEGARAEVEWNRPAGELSWPEAEDDVGVVGYAIVADDEELASLGPEVRTYRVARWEDASRYEIAALDAAGHKTRLSVDTSRIAVAMAQAQVEQMLLGALSAGDMRSVFGNDLGDRGDLMASASGMGVAMAADPFEERGGGGRVGGLGGLGSIGGPTRGSALDTGGAMRPPRIRGRVQVGDVRRQPGQGIFEPQIVQRMIRRRLRAIQICYERELRTTPTIQGQVTVDFTVSLRGTVESVSAGENSTGSTATADCVTRTIRRFRFNPGPEGGDAPFRASFTFAPEAP